MVSYLKNLLWLSLHQHDSSLRDNHLLPVLKQNYGGHKLHEGMQRLFNQCSVPPTSLCNEKFNGWYTTPTSLDRQVETVLTWRPTTDNTDFHQQRIQKLVPLHEKRINCGEGYVGKWRDSSTINCDNILLEKIRDPKYVFRKFICDRSSYTGLHQIAKNC